jgi:hypothetical protein
MKAFLNNFKTSWIEIKEENGNIYLFQFNENNICISDTWHQSINEAKSQAEYQFGIQSDEWIE